MLDDGSFTVLWTQGDYDDGSLSATARFVPGKKKNVGDQQKRANND